MGNRVGLAQREAAMEVKDAEGQEPNRPVIR